MILVLLFAALAFAALTLLLALAIHNALAFPRLRVPPAAAPPLIHPSAETPLVSVLIVARDQANSIAAAVRALRAQRYTPFEVIILDDHSRDGTRAVAEAAAEGDPRFRVVVGQPLLETWLPEAWARHQLSQAANGRVLVFADAGVQWQTEALRAVVALLQSTQADLLSVWPTPILRTRAERLAVPLLALAVPGCLPAPLVHSGRYPRLAVANGACLVFLRAAYNAVGGHIAVRGEALEGVGFARRIKAKGLRLRLADGGGVLARREFEGWRGLREGFAKIPPARYGVRVSIFFFIAAVLLLLALPWLWLLFGWLAPETAGYPVVPLALVALGLAARAATRWVTRERVQDALLTPVSALLLLVIAGLAAVPAGNSGDLKKR
jgi:chlorobactene glucosyltransferase